VCLSPPNPNVPGAVPKHVLADAVRHPLSGTAATMKSATDAVECMGAYLPAHVLKKA